MSKGKPTAGPWAQGVTLSTRETRRWTKEEVEENDKRESLCVFASFSGLDEGRSRILVATCERPEDAQLIASAPTLKAMNDELVEALEDAAYFLGILDLDGNWLVNPADEDPDAHKPGLRRIVDTLAKAQAGEKQ